MNIKLNTVYVRETKKTYEIKEGTKTVWLLTDTKVSMLTEEQYNNVTCKETQQWFRHHGGSEYASRGYTRQGYLVTELISKNPARTIKKVRAFNFGVNLDGSLK